MPIAGERLEERIADGQIVIGGCIMKDEEPDLQCNACGHRWPAESV
jgi:hypothetical protein